MKRRTPLRSKAPPPRPSRQWEGPAPVLGPVRATLRSDGLARMVVLPKTEPIEHEGYRRLVAARPCIACGKWGRSQAAHGPALGKGIKHDDRTCVPLCAEEPGELGCHAKVDRYIMFPRAERVARLDEWGKQTRAQIVADGLWPENLPRWDEEGTYQP